MRFEATLMDYGILEPEDEKFYTRILNANGLDVEFGLYVAKWIGEVDMSLPKFTTKDEFMKSFFSNHNEFLYDDTCVPLVAFHLFKFLKFEDYEDKWGEENEAKITEYSKELVNWDGDKLPQAYSSSTCFFSHFVRATALYWLQYGPRETLYDEASIYFEELDLMYLYDYYSVFQKIEDLKLL